MMDHVDEIHSVDWGQGNMKICIDMVGDKGEI